MIYGLPDKLRNMREKYGLSQHDVAKRLNMSASVISGYETGERTPSVETLLSISYLYNCSIDYLLGKNQPNSTSVLIDVSDLSNEQLRILNDLITEFKKK